MSVCVLWKFFWCKTWLFIQNDEKYFRQFIAGFVGIWEDMINIDFDKNPALWNQIKTNGPPLQVLM